MTADSWHSVDGVWVVHRLPGWIRDGRAGADFYQIKRLGRLIAEVDSFDQVAQHLPVERLVADHPSAIPGQRADPEDQTRQASPEGF